MLPTFGAEPRIGTNPIAVAVPGRHMHPLVLDIATSVVAANKLALARRLGAAVPGNFVARPDGSHAFSATFEEHQRNVELYQR